MRGRCLGGEVGRACVEGWLGVLGSLGLLVPESGLPLCGAGCRWLPSLAEADRSRGNGRQKWGMGAARRCACQFTQYQSLNAPFCDGGSGCVAGMLPGSRGARACPWGRVSRSVMPVPANLPSLQK